MSESELNYTATTCGHCNLAPKEQIDMVACDGCDRWFHYPCVGVTDAVKDEERWFCHEEACQETAKKYKRKKKGSKTPSSGQATVSFDDQLKAMDEERKRLEEEWDQQKILKEKRMELDIALKKKKFLQEQEIRQKQLQLEEEWRAFEFAEREREQQILLKAKQDHLNRVQAQDKTFHEQMALVDQQLAELKINPPGENSKTPLDHSTPINKPKGKTKMVKLTPGESDEDSDTESSATDSSDDSDGGNVEDSAKNPGVKTNELGSKRSGAAVTPDELGEKQSRPTRAQLAARQGIAKHLPFFTGKHGDWPLFYAAYTSTTEACGYSNIDNLARLLQCLKGDAFELVRGQLALPKSVPRVIEKLRQNFGRPEQLLQDLLDRVNELPSPKNLQGFVPFANVVEQLCDHIEAADLKEHLRNPLLIKSLVKKLPDAEKRQWVDIKRARGNKKITLRTIADFLIRVADDAREADVDFDLTSSKSAGGQAAKKKKEKGALFSHAEGDTSSTIASSQKKLKACKVCHRTDHRLRYCQDFKNLPSAERIAMVNRDKLCKICLGEHGGQCRFKFRCSVGDCKEAHNSLIHPVTAVGISAHIRSGNSLLFRIMPVHLYCGETKLTVLAFFDEGASVTLIEGQLADRLGISGTEEKLTIRWTSDVSRVEKQSRRMNIWVSAADDAEKLLLKTVRTVGRLMLPHQELDAGALAAQYPHLRGLPITSYEGQPELLIGLNNIHMIAPLEIKMSSTVDPVAVRCKLGWTAYGPKQAEPVSEGGYACFHQEVTNEDIYDLLKTHYALEESVMATTQESADDKRALEILERTTKRIGDRFETGLLWKVDNPKFPDSRPMALRRLLQLERKLSKNPKLYQKVRMLIAEYLSKGYAHLATEEELKNTDPAKIWYLPINVILNPKKPEKVRIVWDAAALVDGVSLNSLLLKGPDLLVALLAVIVGFREKRICLGGDLREMFHQLRIIAEDRQAQRFLFRSSPEEEPKVYVMDVATFGSASSPSSAQYVKNRNAMEHAAQYPEASSAIINRHYVDDYFDSVDTVEEAVEKAKQVRLIHEKAGFEIRNWISNSPEVLRDLGEEGPSAAVHFNRDKETSKERVLGIVWDPVQDQFSFSTEHRDEANQFLRGGKRPTKRNALSCVMGFFDPLGLLSVFTIHGRIILQNLWRKGCDWDALMDDESWELWRRWVSLLPEVEKIRIPRCYIGDALSSEVESLEVHIFTDASEHAYGCVAYLRAVIRGKVECCLIMSRAKVSPLKRQSIPRLELMAALLGARMYQTILRMHSLPIKRVVFWTDSRTVWSWLRSDQHKFKQFVALRVAEILELTRVTDWRWISTKFNIADVLTKWGRGPALQSDGEWFKGPSFLLLPEEQWPSSELPVEETDEDVRAIVLFHEVIEVETISKWQRLMRVTATVLRFIGNCKRKCKGSPILTAKASEKHLRMLKKTHVTIQMPLTQDELASAEKALWKQIQWDSYPDEMSLLTKNLQLAKDQRAGRIPKSSILYKYSPMLDSDGVLRVDGRLANAATMTFDQKYPVILNRFHDVTQKLIQSYHERFGHANGETVFNEIRKTYEVPNLRAAISHVASTCMWCKVYRSTPRNPRMAPLPVQRVTPGKRPFSSVGIDYLGPVEVTVGRRKEKRWIAVFTCLAVRAVHLEVVHSLSTQSCMMAFNRFACRYGKPDEIFSDNATCFREASNEMERAKYKINQECAEKVTSPTTAWRFIPPGTPHMGGAWERMVRSVKVSMKALDDGRPLSDEVLCTTIAEAADMINTRPLTYVSQQPEGDIALHSGPRSQSSGAKLITP